MKIHNPVNYIAVPFVIIGIAGTAGCMEQGTSPVTAVLLMLLGFALYQNEGPAGRRSRRNKVFALLLAAAIVFCSLPVSAAPAAVLTEDIPEGSFEMYTTAYCHGEITASGSKVREGICAIKKEWIGCTAMVWECTEDGEMGDFLGFWECLDTGFGGDADGDGVGSIEEGKAIDMYFPTLERCEEWMELTGGKVYVQLVYAEG